MFGFQTQQGKKGVSTGGASSQPAKMQRSSGEELDLKQAISRLETFTALLGKFSLSQDFYMRIFKAVLLTVIKMPRTLAFGKAVKLATKSHHEKIQEMKQDRDNTKTAISDLMGPAHLWAWEAALTYLNEVLQLTPIDNQAKIATLGLYAQTLKVSGWKGAMEDCHYFRLQDCYDKDSYRLEFKMKDNSEAETCAEMLVTHLLTLENVVPLPGIPPQGDMARKIQDAIDSQEKK